MPSCIVEMGFMNNAKDNQLFDDNKEAYAAAIGDAIIATYKTYHGDGTGGNTEADTSIGDTDVYKRQIWNMMMSVPVVSHRWQK